MHTSPRLLFWLIFAAGVGVGSTLATLLPTMVAPATARGDPGTSTTINTRTPLAGTYRAQVLQVIDGDTLEARVHVWMGQEVVTRVRIKDIDAPEITGACGPERELAIAARQRVVALTNGPGLVLTDVRPDKYFGRVVARLIGSGDVDVGEALLREGLARTYRGGRRESWCQLPNP